MSTEQSTPLPAQGNTRGSIQERLGFAHQRLDSLGRGQWTLFVVSMYALVTIGFVAVSLIPLNIWTMVPRAVLGGLSLLVFPGALLSSLVVPERFHNLGTSIIVGIIICLITIQAALVLTMLFSVRILLLTVLCIVNSAVVLTSVGILALRHSSLRYQGFWLGSLDNRTIAFMGLALAVRILLGVLASDVIAPDAALYSDFARNVVKGKFLSNIDNDYAVFSLVNGAEYVTHIGFAYIAAISLLMFDVATAGPVLILIIIGVIMIVPAYHITEKYFGVRAAKWMGALLAISPLFVFHSSTAYGPEITSLALLLFGLWLVLEDTDQKPQRYFIAGILFGLVDAVWLANFYILCIAVPILLAFLQKKEPRQSMVFLAVMVVVLAARMLFVFTSVFIILAASAFLILEGAQRLYPDVKSRVYIPMLLGIIPMMVLWNSMFLIGSTSHSSGLLPETTTIWSVILAPIELGVLSRFTFFLCFHLSLTISILLPIALIKARNRRIVIGFFAASATAIVGTLKVFGHFTKETLHILYIYSDSRYFLFIVFMLLPPLAAVLAEIHNPTGKFVSAIGQNWTRRKRNAILIGFIAVGLGPQIVAIPTGLDLIAIEDRYGWNGLVIEVVGIQPENSMFLADRAREFSWLTNRSSVVLEFSNADLPLINSTSELLRQAARYSSVYLLVDEYTTNKWRFLAFLLDYNLTIQTYLPLNLTGMLNIENVTEIYGVESLKLVAQTPEDEHSRFSRLYQFIPTNYSKTAVLETISSGWNASQDGIIEDEAGSIRLTISEGQNRTVLSRKEAFGLNFSTSPGFLLFSIDETSANLTDLELWDSSGNRICVAERIAEGLFFAYVGSEVIGDIMIEIEGVAGDSILLRSISLWCRNS